MDILEKIGKLTREEIVTANIEPNTAKGHIDVIGGRPVKRNGKKKQEADEKCPVGQRWCETRQKCVPLQESREFLNEDEVEKKVIEFFTKNPNPDDGEIHNFSDKMNINTHKFEGIIYGILSSFLSEGRSKDFDGKYDSKELAMGKKVEMEHTSNPLIAERIAKDHLAEISDYYTRLKKMESDAGIED